MNTAAKIYVAGHTGLMGSALVRRLRTSGFLNLVVRSRKELDLTDCRAVRQFFAEERPEYVFLAAARVGGILANATYPADFIGENLLIQTNVIRESYRAGVKRLLFLGSSCIYPKHAPQPMKEDYLLTGPLEPTNQPYALAKISGIEMCWAYNRQYGTQFLAAMPTNLFGLKDRYDLHNSHVIPALLRKTHEAKVTGAAEVVIWGTGTARREFLFSDDAADACMFLMTLSSEQLKPILTHDQTRPIINVGCGQDLAVSEAAELVASVVGFKGRLVFDSSKPDGTPRKLLDTSRLTSLGWLPQTSLQEGLKRTYLEFWENIACYVNQPSADSVALSEQMLPSGALGRHPGLG
jgi:GDP-L-fucose synthase